MKAITRATIAAAAVLIAAPGATWAQEKTVTPTVESICDDAQLTMVEKAACRGQMQMAGTEAEKLRIRLQFEEKIAAGPRAADEPKPNPTNPPVRDEKTPL